MTEELANFCTDLKELFMRQELEEMERMLAEKKQEEIAELAMNQHDIIEGYYRQKKYEVLFSHLTFVAFARYLFEYAGKHGFFTKVEFQNGFKVFEDIYRMLKEAEQKK